VVFGLVKEGEPYMDAAITMREAGLIVLGIGLIILVFYGAYLIKNLAATVKSVNKILADAEVISEIAAKRSKDVDKLIGDATESMGSLADIIKGNQSTVAALTSIINAFGSLKNLIRIDKKEGDKSKKK
jgi:ABC-type transporter Mla subunit MlaD